MGILNRMKTWVERHRPDTLSKGSPHRADGVSEPRRRISPYWKAAATASLSCLIILMSAITAFADTTKSISEEIGTNGVYTVIAIDEAGNRTVHTITIDNIVPKQITDEEGNILPDDTIPDTDYTEEIIATLMSDAVVTTNGVYTVLVLDAAGNLVKETVTVTNIQDDGIDDGEDAEGNVVPDDDTVSDEDYTEDIIETMTGTGTATSNGIYTAFVKDKAGNVVKRSYTITNIVDQATVQPDQPIAPAPDLPDTDEDYTEEIRENLSSETTVYSNGTYTSIVYDEAGNATFVEIRIENIYEKEKEEDGETQPDDPDDPNLPTDDDAVEIFPDDIPDTEDDYVEDIIAELVSMKRITESGIYAAIGVDQAGGFGINSVTVTILDSEEEDDPFIDVIEPDEPGGEEPSLDGSTMTDTTTVYENGYYAAGSEDNVGNIGVETILVKNIGAPEIQVLKNPATLVRKTNVEDGSTYGEATITFTVNIPDGTLVDTVLVVNEAGVEQPLTVDRGVYTTTVQKNGTYSILAVDVTGRDTVYPLAVDYIFELDTPETFEVERGQTAVLDACVVGGRPETYQWYTCNSDGTGAVALAGETNSTLSIENVTYQNNDTYYFCVATKGEYQVVSKAIRLVVYFPPVMESAGYANAAEGREFTLTIGKEETDSIRIVVDGNPTDYTYQWYYATSAKGEKRPIAGATGTSYTGFATKEMNGWYYFVEVSAGQCKEMSDSIYLYVYGKPTAPIFVATLEDGTVIENGSWAVEVPLYLTMGGSTASGAVGFIEYEYSYDQIDWFSYENALVFSESTEGTTVYGRAVNVSLNSVVSDVAQYTVQIELDDPYIHETPDDVVPGVQYDQETWVNHPRYINLFVNTLSGVTDITVYFKGEGDVSFQPLVDGNGNSIYYVHDTLVDGTHFTNTRIEEGLWCVTFGAAENGWYMVEFRDAAGRPLDGQALVTQAFEVKNIDYGIPTIGSVTVDKTGKQNSKTLTVADVYDEYTDSIYGYSGMYGFAYVKDSVEPPAKDDPIWTAFTSENSTYTTDANGNKHYTFDIYLEGRDANGTYSIWTRDVAGNVNELTTFVVDGLADKMKDVTFPVDKLSLTTPTDGVIEVAYDGEAGEIIVKSSNEKAATVSYQFPNEDMNDGCNVIVTPEDMGKATITITLRDYDGTEYNHTVDVTVQNMKPYVEVEPPDTPVLPNGDAKVVFTAAGTNLTYKWYTSSQAGINGREIDPDDENFEISVVSVSKSQHIVTLTVKNCTMSMNGNYYWCEFVTTEGTPEYTATTRAAELQVVGEVGKPTVTATSDGKSVISGQWTSKDIEFHMTGGQVTTGAGTPGYEYRYEGDTEWTVAEDDTFLHEAAKHSDTAGRTVYIRSFNKLLDSVVSEAVTYVIKQDTVAPTIVVTGNPTEWTSTSPTLTATLTDHASGITNETVNIYVTNEAGTTLSSGSTPVVDNKTFTFIVTTNGTLTVHAHDVAGNDAAYTLIVTKVDKHRPNLSVNQSFAGGGFAYVELIANDTHDGVVESTDAELLYSFDGGNTWSDNNLQILQIGATYTLGAKDAAGNITLRVQKITGTNDIVVPDDDDDESGGNSYLVPELISTFELDIAGFQFGKDYYINANGEKKSYVSHPDTGEKCLPVEVTAYPYDYGYLTGYAQVNSSTKYPLTWYGAEVSNVGGTAVFYITADTLLQSARSARVTVYVAEFEDADLKKKTYSDSITTTVMVDVTAPVTNISLNTTTKQVTITTRDVLTGLESVQFAIETTSGSISGYQDYVGPFTLPDNCKRIHVKAVDKVGNEGVTVSADLTGAGASVGGALAGSIYAGSYYYRTATFNYWLIGSNESNTEAVLVDPDDGT